MLTRPRPTALALSLAAALPLLALPLTALAETPEALAPIVITAPPMSTPIETSFNPRAPQQPLPANDGASLLKALPGMSVIRKGGTDGDPVFRGMAASRLNIVVDGAHVLGGCGMRMDPPTAYIFPDAFDKVTLLKGPQTVLRGPGGSAGTVLFERQPVYFDQPGWTFKSALTGASANRHDAYVDVLAGSPKGYVHGIATHAASGDYEDGDRRPVHSAYKRGSITGVAGWTPDRHTRLELTMQSSRAEAAYGDRGMDGAAFDRRHVGIRFDKRHIGTVLDRIEAQLYDSYVDHVMDNFSLRTPPASTAMWMASNPDRATTGGRLALTLRPNDRDKVVMGLDQQRNTHTLRKSGMGGDTVSPYDRQPRAEDARFDTLGLFGELTHELNDAQRVVAGLRQDEWQASDRRLTISSSMGMSLGANPTAGQSRDDSLHSGFVRFEHDLGEASQLYAGLGHTQRPPDYWELIGKESAGSLSAFDSIQPEKTTQLDIGWTHKQGPLQGFVSGFVSQAQDYILIQTNVIKPAGMGSRTTTIARNVDARTWGGEAGMQYAITRRWATHASVAYTHGHNRTDDRALGQMPPFEARLGLNWDKGAWSAGGLWRLVSSQNRYAINEGNIVGQDIGRSSGFGVLSLNGGYRYSKAITLTAGVDNLLDKTYAEAISRGGAAMTGYEQTTRINEPGRTWWLKLQIDVN